MFKSTPKQENDVEIIDIKKLNIKSFYRALAACWVLLCSALKKRFIELKTDLLRSVPALKIYFPVKLNINEDNELVRQQIQEKESGTQNLEFSKTDQNLNKA